MKHLRQVGLQEDGVDSVLLEAQTSLKKPLKKPANFESVLLRDLPEEALPSRTELPREFVAQSSVPDELAGLQPDMNPHLRQALEALEDDAFVDDGLKDDFFQELVQGGERSDKDPDVYEFEEVAESVSDTLGEGAEPEDWEARFKAFKKEQTKMAGDDEEHSDDFSSDGRSEAADMMGELPILPTSRKRRRKGQSDASGYSMSSSSMYRNAGLTLLDEKFDKVSRLFTIMSVANRQDRSTGTTLPMKKWKMTTTRTMTLHL